MIMSDKIYVLHYYILMVLITNIIINILNNDF